MLTFRELVNVLRGLGINRRAPLLVHTSLSALGEVSGGAETLVGALLANFDCVVMPAFTYKTMIIPEVGPAGNGLVYGSGKDTNLMAQVYRPSMPVDRLIGAAPEALRLHAKAQRSMHPVLSFVGVNATETLTAQTLAEPLAPIRLLAAAGGWVLLLGVDHSSNTSIHYGERLAGRKQFVRWALASSGVMECPAFPGCSQGFNAITPLLEPAVVTTRVGEGLAQGMALEDLLPTVRARIEEDPLALLCNSLDCGRCNAVRAMAG